MGPDVDVLSSSRSMLGAGCPAQPLSFVLFRTAAEMPSSRVVKETVSNGIMQAISNVSMNCQHPRQYIYGQKFQWTKNVLCKVQVHCNYRRPKIAAIGLYFTQCIFHLLHLLTPYIIQGVEMFALPSGTHGIGYV